MTKDVTADRLDRPTLVGLVACAIPVAAFSAWSQFETAYMTGVPVGLAWVHPVTTDATGFVATRVWLSPRYNIGTRRYAATIAVCCIALAFAGAAIHLALGDATPPNWLRWVVGGLPSLALAALVHLGAMLANQGRDKAKAPKVKDEKPVKARKTPSQPAPQSAGAAEHRPPTSAVPASTPEIPAETGSEVNPAAEVASPVASPEVGQGSRRERMLAYLDEHGETTGVELDRLFGTKNYGRGVLRTWRRRHPQAAGE